MEMLTLSESRREVTEHEHYEVLCCDKLPCRKCRNSVVDCSSSYRVPIVRDRCSEGKECSAFILWAIRINQMVSLINAGLPISVLDLPEVDVV